MTATEAYDDVLKLLHKMHGLFEVLGDGNRTATMLLLIEELERRKEKLKAETAPGGVA